MQIRTGPDGALWVVDMYRFVVEHPRWITPDRLKTLDIRAGADMGRIYRVYPKGKNPRKIQNLVQLSPDDLAHKIDSENGTERDRVQLELLRRKDRSVIPILSKIAEGGSLPQIRIQAFSAIESLDPAAVSPLAKTFFNRFGTGTAGICRIRGRQAP